MTELWDDVLATLLDRCGGMEVGFTSAALFYATLAAFDLWFRRRDSADPEPHATVPEPVRAAVATFRFPPNDPRRLDTAQQPGGRYVVDGWYVDAWGRRLQEVQVRDERTGSVVLTARLEEPGSFLAGSMAEEIAAAVARRNRISSEDEP